MLQARLFSYVDTHRHRLGANYAQIMVNCPLRTVRLNTYGRDGPLNVQSQVKKKISSKCNATDTFLNWND